MRPFTVALLALLAGCSSTETYTRSPKVLAGQEVAVRARVEDGTLYTQTAAGRFAVEQVTLVLADGSTLDPTLSATTQSTDRDGGGWRLGTGVGTGVGSGVGVGVGTSFPIGGGRSSAIVTAREARWAGAPFEQQPFTMRITLDTDPPTVVHVPLGRVVESEPAQSSSGRVETWKFPDDTKRRYLVTDNADADTPPTYHPAD